MKTTNKQLKEIIGILQDRNKQIEQENQEKGFFKGLEIEVIK